MFMCCGPGKSLQLPAVLFCLVIVCSSSPASSALQRQAPDAAQQTDVPHEKSINKRLIEVISQYRLGASIDLQAIQALLADGANVDAVDIEGKTPLAIAAMRGHLELMRFLLSKGADVNKKNAFGNPILCEANDAAAKLLLDHGANPNVTTNGGETLLIIAIQYESVARVKLLIESGVNVNQKGRYLQSPLFVAIDNGKSEIGKLLKKVGATMSNSEAATIRAHKNHPTIKHTGRTQPNT